MTKKRIKSLIAKSAAEWDALYPFVMESSLIMLYEEESEHEMMERIAKFLNGRPSGRFERVRVDCPEAPTELSSDDTKEFTDAMVAYCETRGGWWTLPYDGTGDREAMTFLFREHDGPAGS